MVGAVVGHDKRQGRQHPKMHAELLDALALTSPKARVHDAKTYQLLLSIIINVNGTIRSRHA